MPRKAAGVTAGTVQKARPGRYGDGAGLYLLVRSAEAKFWLFRYSMHGKMREMGLGPAVGPSKVLLADARMKARKLHDMVREGRDPLAEREATKAAVRAAEAKGRRFREVTEMYLSANEAGWRNGKHRQQWEKTLVTYAFPYFGDMRVDEIETQHVMQALEPIWQTKTETATRVRGRIETVLDYAKARGWRKDENPARWRGHIANLLPKRSKVAPTEHYTALPYREIGVFMSRLRAQKGLAARALELAILTACRSGEVLKACWSEINLDIGVWNIPAERMKNRREHRVPLSPQAVALLRDVFRTEIAWVFPGERKGRPLSNMAMAMALRRMGRDDLTVHGFRSTFRDWAAETTNHPREVAEAALAHTISDKVEAAYRRGDLFNKRRRLMEEWASVCST